MGDASARQITASSSLLLALAAVVVHSAAMLAVTGGVAAGVCRGAGAMRRSARLHVTTEASGTTSTRSPSR